MSQLESVRMQLAEFFCEDPLTFKIEECFKIFYQFCEKFKAAVRDNEKRRFLEEQANLRRKQREELLAARKKQIDHSSNSHNLSTESDNCFLMDPPNFSYDIRFSPALSRRRIGSFNSNSESFSREDTASPDVTPNGSLRRRRSRALPEEDDHNNLMDFLRSSGHSNYNRERRSAAYGSLDRSWARRARSGSAEKRRPNLLQIDFGADRERPSSPSPNVEVKELPAEAETEVEESKPRISREWRQKIENWLQGNEQDEKLNEENRKKAASRRATVNRRSLENDTDSEKGSKLDTLPEEKSHNSSPQQATASSSLPVETPSSYRRVYSEWKPSTSLENADVINKMEAISGMTCEFLCKFLIVLKIMNNILQKFQTFPSLPRRTKSTILNAAIQKTTRSRSTCELPKLSLIIIVIIIVRLKQIRPVRVPSTFDRRLKRLCQPAKSRSTLTISKLLQHSANPSKAAIALTR